MKTSLVSLLLSLVAFTAATPRAARADDGDAGQIRVYALDCGHGEFKDMGIFSDTDDYNGKPGAVSDPCILIHHPEGWMMWDTGFSEKLIGHPMDNPRMGAHMSREISIADQLKTLNLTISDIKYVGFSHVHSDHTGNANLFKDATWLIQEKELAYANSKPTPGGVEPDTLSSQKTAKKNLLRGDHDVFGDGRVRILSTPGHTPGHQSLMVKLKDEGTVIFSGDLFHQRESFEHKHVPIFNFSRAETLASIDRIQGLIKTNKAKLYVQHDAGDTAKLPKLPGYLK